MYDFYDDHSDSVVAFLFLVIDKYLILVQQALRKLPGREGLESFAGGSCCTFTRMRKNHSSRSAWVDDLGDDLFFGHGRLPDTGLRSISLS